MNENFLKIFQTHSLIIKGINTPGQALD
ncbi:MAG: hypothetical protein ACD_56C00114G0007, partial [uncultured bacterium]